MTTEIRRNKLIKAILTTLTILFILFIWSRSLASGEESTAQSDSVLKFITDVFNSININININSFIIRKMAHFLEFMVLGVLLTATVACYTDSFKNEIFKMLFILLAVPVSDETMQYISPDRGPQVSDVLLDFSGCITGWIVTILIITLIKKIKNRKYIKTETC